VKFTREQLKAAGIPVPPRDRGNNGRSNCISRKTKQDKRSDEALFDAFAMSHGLERPTHEYRWNEAESQPFINPNTGKPYPWRFDYLWGDVAVERVGGVWSNGHHSGGQDQIDDMHRRNCAQILGYVVLEFTPEQLDSGEAFAAIRRALGMEAKP